MNFTEALTAARAVAHYLTLLEKELRQSEEERRRLVKRNAELTVENLDLKGRLDTALGHDASADDKENAELELKETRELAEQKP
jgi:regulator of replication initiation timing